jgi:hypothetical protein
MTLKMAAKAPVVDGYLDDAEDPWAALTPMAVRNPGGTTTGMTGSFNLLDSKDAFYLAVKIEDATPNNDATAIPNTYERDCTETLFSMDTVTAAAGAYITGCWQIRTQREGDALNDGNSGANTWAITALLADPMFAVASASSATEYIQEIVLPKGVLSDAMDPAWDKAFVRFDVGAADNTTGVAGGRTEQRYWYGHDGLGDDGGWNNTKAMGIVKLAGTSVSSLKTVQGSAFVKNNILNVKNVNGVVNIYNVKGTLVRKSVINGNGTIEVADLASGLYIVKSNGLSVKFVK